MDLFGSQFLAGLLQDSNTVVELSSLLGGGIVGGGSHKLLLESHDLPLELGVVWGA